MSPQRILITGATGFIGARIAERLEERGHQLALLLRAPKPDDRAGAIYGRCQIIQGDLFDRASYAAALHAFRPETLVHVAWSGVAGAERNAPYQLDNVTATAELLEETIAAGATNFVGFGSQAEYGPQNRKIDEETPTEPTTLYGQSKLAACRVTAAMCRMKIVRHAWLRVFSTFGPRDNPSWLIPTLIAKLRAGDVMAMTPCEQVWDFLYVDDAADAAVAVVETKLASGIFNLGSGRGLPLRETVNLLRDIVRPDGEIGFGKVPYRPDQVMHLEADISRLKSATGWTPSVDMETALKQTVQWYRSVNGENK